MVSVPAGKFWMGCNDAVDKACQGDEVPYHEVTLGAFEIDRTEVTAAAYRACVQAGGCTVPWTTGGDWGTYDPVDKRDHPINYMNWVRATAYCSWAGKRLCTEAEWEKAARGTDGRKYPWGNDEASCAYAVMNEDSGGCGTDATWAVGSKPAGDSPYGAADMAGNVWEWVQDWYGGSYYENSPMSNPQGPSTGTYRVIRGGCFVDAAAVLRASIRGAGYPADSTGVIGFRCCRSN